MSRSVRLTEYYCDKQKPRGDLTDDQAAHAALSVLAEEDDHVRRHGVTWVPDQGRPWAGDEGLEGTVHNTVGEPDAAGGRVIAARRSTDGAVMRAQCACGGWFRRREVKSRMARWTASDWCMACVLYAAFLLFVVDCLGLG